MDQPLSMYICTAQDLRISNSFSWSMYPAFFPNNVIERILRELSSKDRLQARLLNQSTNESFKWTGNLEAFTYTVDGTNAVSGYKSLQTLMDSSVLWRHLRFKRFHLERELLGNEVGFLFFTRTFCPSLKSLTLHNCQVRLGRLIELLTFCDSLTHLHIINCSAVFKTTIEVIHWSKFFGKFLERLESLEGLEIVEQTQLTDDALWAFMGSMKNLKRLKIHTGAMEFPTRAVVDGVRRNMETLIDLDVSGVVSKDKPSLWKLMLQNNWVPLRLEVLKIQRVKLCPMKAFDSVMCRLENLKSLFLDHLYLSELFFSQFSESLPFLGSVVIQFCMVHPAVLDHLAECPTLKSVTFIKNAPTSDSFQLFDRYMSFFKTTASLLESVTINSSDGCKLIPAIALSQSCLKSLNLSGVLGIKKFHLLPLRAVRLTLKSLKMKGCDVDDDSFVGEPSFLGALSALETLDLSQTKVGDRTVQECFLKLSKLNHLDLSLTNVTPEILEIVSSSFLSILTI